MGVIESELKYSKVIKSRIYQFNMKIRKCTLVFNLDPAGPYDYIQDI